MDSKAKSKATAQHKASGFSLDYACSLSVRKGHSKTHANSGVQHKERRD